jgi:peroxiredoxin
MEPLMFLLPPAHIAAQANTDIALSYPYSKGPWSQSVPVPPLTAFTAGGDKVELAPKNTWRVIYFWSAQCPCVAACEEYSLIPLAAKYKGKVAFYGVVSGSYDLTRRDDLQKNIAARKLPYPVLLDKDHSIAKALNAKVTPQTFVIDPKGKVVFSGMPDDSRRFLGTKAGGGKHSYLADALRQALAGKPVARPWVENEGCVIYW